jgi:hypothetical protein
VELMPMMERHGGEAFVRQRRETRQQRLAAD